MLEKIEDQIIKQIKEKKLNLDRGPGFPRSVCWFGF